MSKAIETSRTRLWERLQTVLSSQLGTKLTAMTDAGLYLPAPDSDGYHITKDGGATKDLRTNHEVAVFMWANGARFFPNQALAGPTSYIALSHLPIVVELHARTAPQGDFTKLGKVLPPEEVELWRAERYLGALTYVIFKHIRTADDIYNIALTSDSTLLDDGWTIARTEWLPQQEVLIPTPDYSTV